MLFLGLFVTLTMAGCNALSLKIDPCMAYWETNKENSKFLNGWCVPLNNPKKPEYERAPKEGDVFVTAEEYAAIQKHYREMLRRCGDRCK